MEIKAKATNLGISARKLRLLTKPVLGMTAQKAIEKLAFYPQIGNIFLIKALKQAVANAKNNFKLGEDNLVVARIEVGDGPSFKRMDKSHSARFDRGLIKKRTAMLSLVLKSPDAIVKENKPVKKAEPKTKIEVNPPSLKLRRTRGTKN